MLEKYIDGLIERMITDEGILPSDKSISFLAYRVAEQLAKPITK